MRIHAGWRRGFTLVELIAVLILVSIAAISIAPAMDTVERSREAGVRDEIERRLLMARAHAMTTGMPSGVRFDLGTQMAEAVEIVSAGGAPTKMSMQNHDDGLSASFAGAGMTDVSLDGGGVHDTVWFNIEGTPHYRTGGGVYVSGLTQDAVVTVTGGGTVTVRMTTGLIE